MARIARSVLLGAAVLCGGGAAAAAQSMVAAPSNFSLSPVSSEAQFYDSPHQAAAAGQHYWTGFYVGAHLGYNWSTTNATSTSSITGVALGSGSSDDALPSGGLRVGYDYQLPSRIVVGASASLSMIDSSSANTTVTQLPGATFAQTSTADTDWSGDILGRVGYAFDRALAYGTAGWAWQSGSLSRTQNLGTIGLARPGTSEKTGVFRSGWTGGGGVEYALTNQWDVYAEYRHTAFSAVATSFPLSHVTTTQSTNSDGMTFGLNYRY